MNLPSPRLLPFFQWFGPIFFRWYLGREMSSVEAPRLLKGQSHSVNTTQKDSCTQGKKGLLLLAEAVTRVHRAGRSCWVHVCVSHKHAHVHRLQSWVAALTSASTRLENEHQLLPWASCGVSTGSPRRPPSGPSRCAFSFFSAREKCERKSERSNRQTSFCPWDHSGRELKGFQMLAVPWWPALRPPFSPPLTFCPDHPSGKPALPRAQYHHLFSPLISGSQGPPMMALTYSPDESKPQGLLWDAGARTGIAQMGGQTVSRGDRPREVRWRKRLASWLSGRICFLASPLSETSVGLWGERRRGTL